MSHNLPGNTLELNNPPQPKHQFSEVKIKKLEQLRQTIKEQEIKNKIVQKTKKQEKGPQKLDYYSAKLYRFLTSSFIINLALEPYYLFVFIFDHIYSYINSGQTTISFIPTNTLQLFFYIGKSIGLFMSRGIVKSVQYNVRIQLV